MEPVALVVLLLVVLLAAAAAVFLARRRRPGEVVPSPSLAERLATPRRALSEALRSVLGRSSLDAGFWTGLEEALLSADVGVAVSTEIIEGARSAGPESPRQARAELRRGLLSSFAAGDRELRRQGRPSVILVVGVNGTGKTTTIAKLAANLRRGGATSLLGAADTFRAGADAQLRIWADRVGVEVVSGQPGADPAAVAFDAIQAAKARGRDVVIIDTAGRLHSKQNLMTELGKVVRVLEREVGKLEEVLLVLDATTGQNGLAQARAFTDAVGVTGIVLTKLDGTAKGGIVVAVERELGIPVKLIGVGEGVDDLVPFDPEAFVDALLSEEP